MNSWQEIAEWDWVLCHEDDDRWTLHAVASMDDPDGADTDWGGPGTTACGLASEWLAIPGLTSRMSAPRCSACCKATGFPEGTGSPKNDDACRPLIEARIAALSA